MRSRFREIEKYLDVIRDLTALRGAAWIHQNVITGCGNLLPACHNLLTAKAKIVAKPGERYVGSLCGVSCQTVCVPGNFIVFN